MFAILAITFLSGCQGTGAFLQGMSNGFYQQTNPQGYYNQQYLEAQQRQAVALERMDRLQRYGF